MSKNEPLPIPEFILAIDTGITTGYAVVNDAGTVVKTGNLKYVDDFSPEGNDEEVDELLLIEALMNISDEYNGFIHGEVIVEYALTPTNSALDNRLRYINQLIKSVFPKAEVILPATWKNSRVTNKPIFPMNYGKLTQHQKDAIMIARFKLQQYLKH